MIDMSEIDSTIDTLENTPISFDVAFKLAALYVVRDHNKVLNLGVLQSEKGTVEGEWSDILPQYQKYMTIKRDFQTNVLPKSAVVVSIDNVCREIEELIDAIYSGTDMQEERQSIISMISNLSEKYA